MTAVANAGLRIDSSEKRKGRTGLKRQQTEKEGSRDRSTEGTFVSLGLAVS